MSDNGKTAQNDQAKFRVKNLCQFIVYYSNECNEPTNDVKIPVLYIKQKEWIRKRATGS